MEPMTIALIAGAIAGGVKAHEQQKEAKRLSKIEATKELWAPFTGRRGQTVTKPSVIDPIMQSMLAGAMMGGQFKKGAAATEAGGGVNRGGGAPLANAQPYQGAGPTSHAAPDMDMWMMQQYFQPYGSQQSQNPYIAPGGG